MQMVLIPWH